MRSFWASQITTATYSNEVAELGTRYRKSSGVSSAAGEQHRCAHYYAVVPLSFKYNFLQITIHYEG